MVPSRLISPVTSSWITSSSAISTAFRPPRGTLAAKLILTPPPRRPVTSCLRSNSSAWAPSGTTVEYSRKRALADSVPLPSSLTRRWCMAALAVRSLPQNSAMASMRMSSSTLPQRFSMRSNELVARWAELRPWIVYSTLRVSNGSQRRKSPTP